MNNRDVSFESAVCVVPKAGANPYDHKGQRILSAAFIVQRRPTPWLHSNPYNWPLRCFAINCNQTKSYIKLRLASITSN